VVRKKHEVPQADKKRGDISCERFIEPLDTQCSWLGFKSPSNGAELSKIALGRG
jgi:hypothetical protein